MEVPVTDAAEELVLALVAATRADERLALGASPRATVALYRGAQALAAVRGRDEATAEEVAELASAVLQKRIAVRPEFQLKGVDERQVIAQLLERSQEARVGERA